MNFVPTADVFRPYLSPRERILWTGQPKQGLAFSRSDVAAIPFSLMWCGFVIYWNFSVWTDFPNTGTAGDWFFKLWGLPFLAIGLYLIAGRFFYDAWIRNRSYYAVTNERVLIIHNRPTSKLISRDIQALPMFELSEHRDGTGTIVFDSDEAGYSMFIRSRRTSNFWAPAAGTNAQFFRIAEPRKVYELIRNQSHS